MNRILGWLLLTLGGALGLHFVRNRAVAGPGRAIEPIPEVVGARYPFSAEVGAAAQKYGVDPALVAAVISWEQRSLASWDPRETNPNDPSYGLGQVTPYIGVRFGIIGSAADYAELYDPGKNCMAVAAFLDYLLNEKKYPLETAIQMYNEGEPNYWAGGRVTSYLNGVLGYLEKINA